MTEPGENEGRVQFVIIPPQADDPALKLMRERAARANIGAALAILDALPSDLPPDPGDELPE